MFRDFKEYQEIAKLYTEKVSKTENLEEDRNQMAMKLRQEREANKPKTREEVREALGVQNIEHILEGIGFNEIGDDFIIF